VEQAAGRVKRGELICAACGRGYPILDFIPRMISDESNYTAGFGFQWNKHFQTQYDRHSGAPISEERFFNETRWPRMLQGEVMLEAGSGSGRFTVHAASTGAMVVSFDYSQAVDVNYCNNGQLDNVLIVQASIFEMPFRKDYFDKVLCIGVIQHTPDPEQAFMRLCDVLKPKGPIVIDVYAKLPWWQQIFQTKYWVRPITRKIPSPVLYRLCASWVNVWWGLTGWAVRLTGRRVLSWLLLIADYRGQYPLSDSMQKEWSILDTFDMLSPVYDFPQTIPQVRGWFEKAGLVRTDVHEGYNGIEGRGFKP
jgi:SAM-dependent methyltransferase